MDVISVRNLSKTFRVKEKEKGLKGSFKSIIRPRYKTIQAVDNISFNVKQGEILAFIGPNGAGKSTTIKMLTGILYPDVKYNIMREMANHVTFTTNVLFMILNDAAFIFQWLLFFQLKDNIGGYKFADVLILWGLAASIYGFSHIFFKRAFELPDLIINGKLDSFLVQPKNVLLSVISSGTSAAAIGDLLYGIILLCVFRFSIGNLLLFLLFTATGGLIITSFAVILSSLSFWFVKGDFFADSLIGIMINVATFPDGIFKGVVKLLLYSVVPVGLAVYMPVKLIISFHIGHLLAVLGFTALMIGLAFFVFYRGLRRYYSSNLMSARI